MNHFNQQLNAAFKCLNEARKPPLETKSGRLKATRLFKKLKRARKLTWQHIQQAGLDLNPNDIAQNWHTMPPGKEQIYTQLYRLAPSLFTNISNEQEIAIKAQKPTRTTDEPSGNYTIGQSQSDWRQR